MAPKSNYGFGLKSKIRAMASIPENLEYKLTFRNFTWSLSNAPSGQKRIDKLWRARQIIWDRVCLFYFCKFICRTNYVFRTNFDLWRVWWKSDERSFVLDGFIRSLDCSFCRSVSHVWWKSRLFLWIVGLDLVYCFTLSYKLSSEV